MTLQLAPGIPASKRRPQSGTLPEWGFHWYNNLTYGTNVSINPFFYGNYLGATKPSEPIFRSEDMAYQCDALSSMQTIGKEHFSAMHRYRLEWQPGATGYVRWYVDGEFSFGIDAAGLEEQGSAIPDEPSYIIFNTALSTSWGFPNAPPGCDDYDCKDPAKRCGFNAGFCESLPAEFKIDHVRVYQRRDDPLQTLGCNPRDKPTRKFIIGHEYRYKLRDDVHALKPVHRGGGKCKTDKGCGEGRCQRNQCACRADWTGPNCLVPDYKNDFPDWEAEAWDMSLAPPLVPTFLGFCVALLTGGLLVASAAFARSKRL